MLKTVVLIISKLWIACREERESVYITNDFSFNRRISSRAILIAESSAVYTLDLSGRRTLLIWFPQITAQAMASPVLEPSVYISTCLPKPFLVSTKWFCRTSALTLNLCLPFIGVLFDLQLWNPLVDAQLSYLMTRVTTPSTFARSYCYLFIYSSFCLPFSGVLFALQLWKC